VGLKKSYYKGKKKVFSVKKKFFSTKKKLFFKKKMFIEILGLCDLLIFLFVGLHECGLFNLVNFEYCFLGPPNISLGPLKIQK